MEIRSLKLLKEDCTFSDPAQHRISTVVSGDYFWEGRKHEHECFGFLYYSKAELPTVGVPWQCFTAYVHNPGLYEDVCSVLGDDFIVPEMIDGNWYAVISRMTAPIQWSFMAYLARMEVFKRDYRKPTYKEVCDCLPGTATTLTKLLCYYMAHWKEVDGTERLVVRSPLLYNHSVGNTSVKRMVRVGQTLDVNILKQRSATPVVGLPSTSEFYTIYGGLERQLASVRDHMLSEIAELIQ